MKAEKANSRQLDILGNGHRSDQEIFSSVLKQWRKKLGYCSIFAAVPAFLASQLHVARSAEIQKPAVSVAGAGARLPKKLNMSFNNPALLKRQSEFRLPHQQGSFDTVSTLAGKDDCPGQAIPGGNYTAAAPYTDSGDTTGANDTVTNLQYYYYYSFEASGPDHAYSFTLTARGPNPRIEVSTTSGTYKPLVYVLYGGNGGGCPAGTGNTAYAMVSSGADPGGTATLDKYQMNYLPLNVPLHLFIDAFHNDASGSGPYKIKIQDVTIAPASVCSSANPIDCADFFVRQQYLDFLGREPDPAGSAGWQNILSNCASGDTRCDRIEVASAFFRSPEFQGRGYFIYRFYSIVGKIPRYEEFTPDFDKVKGFLSDQQLEANKAAFVNEFIARAEFQNKYGATFNSPTAYVDALLQTVGLPNHPSRQAWINSLNANNTALTRAQVLRSLVESAEVSQKYYNEAFVILQYFGFLHRTADAAYIQWIQTMNQNGGDYRQMINGFVNSAEYRKRFGP
jgi:hypothetical protein